LSYLYLRFVVPKPLGVRELSSKVTGFCFIDDVVYQKETAVVVELWSKTVKV
jgi:hypothetical protein